MSNIPTNDDVLAVISEMQNCIDVMKEMQDEEYQWPALLVRVDGGLTVKFDNIDQAAAWIAGMM